jgi:hypothetical protein
MSTAQSCIRRPLTARKSASAAAVAGLAEVSLAATEFRACTEQGKWLDSHQVIDLALDAIARAATAAGPA